MKKNIEELSMTLDDIVKKEKFSKKSNKNKNSYFYFINI